MLFPARLAIEHLQDFTDEVHRHDAAIRNVTPLRRARMPRALRYRRRRGFPEEADPVAVARPAALAGHHDEVGVAVVVGVTADAERARVPGRWSCERGDLAPSAAAVANSMTLSMSIPTSISQPTKLS